VGSPFLAVKLSSQSVWAGSHWLRAVTIESLLCGLSYRSVQKCYKGSWVNFWSIKTEGNWEHGMFKESIGLK